MIYQKVKIKYLPNSQVEIDGEVTADFFDQCYEETVEHLRQSFEAPGFRKGHVPLEIFREKVNASHLLEETAETALREVYPEIIRDYKLRPLSAPQISITKLAPKNPLGFSAHLTIRPEIKLPDYKHIAQKTFSHTIPIELKDEEVESFVKQILEMESKIRTRNQPGVEASPAILTDELAKELGPFEGAEDFRAKIREDMIAQKKSEAAQDKREVLAKALIEASSLTLPQEIVNQETETSLEQILNDLKKANLTFEEYLKKLEKTEEQFRKEKREQIENQIKLRFLLEDIAELEHLHPSKEAIETEVSRVKKNYPEVSREQLADYVELVMRHEAVLKFLESLSSTT